MDNFIFWKWWTYAITLVFLITIGNYQFEILNFIYVSDPTFITFGIFVIASITISVIGYHSYNIQFKNKYPSSKQSDALWFVSDVVMSIGMLGTLLGFLMVLTSAFGNIDTGDVEQIKKVIAELATGMGVALLTSLAGLISSIIIKSQLLLLDK